MEGTMLLFVCTLSKIRKLTLAELPPIFTERLGYVGNYLRRQMISKKKKCWKMEGALLAKFSYGLFLMCHVF